MANNHTAREVLTHHGIITPTTRDESIVDEARAAGIIYLCLGCGSVGGTHPALGEAARVRTKDAIDWDEFECCTDANVYVY